MPLRKALLAQLVDDDSCSRSSVLRCRPIISPGPPDRNRITGTQPRFTHTANSASAIPSMAFSICSVPGTR